MNYIDPGQTPDDFYNFCSSIDGSVFSLYADKLHRLGVSSGSFNRSNIVESLTQGGIPLIAAGDIVSEFHEKFRKSKNMGIFWDYENIKPELGQQTGVQIMASIRQRMSIFAEVLEMHIYVPAHLVDAALQFPGAVVHYVPVNRRYEVADKMIIVDAIGYAFDTKDPIVCIISGDSDFSALISKLQMLGVRTIAVTEDNSSVRSMRSVSMLNLSWPSDFMDAAAASPGYYTGRSASSRPVSPAVRSVSPTTTSQFDNNNSNNNNGNPKPPAFSTSHAKSPTRATLAVPPPRDSWAAVSPTTTTSSTGTPPRRSQQYLGAPKSSDTANILAPFSPLFRRNSTLVQAAPTPVFSEEEMNTASKSDFLVILLTKLKEQTGSRKIPEALVAKVLRQNFGGVSLNSFTGPALLRGAIEIGNSSGGVAWIGLPKQRGSNRASNNSGDSEDSSTVASYSEESSSSSSSSSNNTMLGARANTLKYDSAPPPPPTSGTAHPSPATSSSSLLSAASANITNNNTGSSTSSSAAATTSTSQNLPHPRSETGNNARTPATPAASTSASFAPSDKPFYVSYRLLKNHRHSAAILNLRQSDFDNFRIDIVDTQDRDEPEKYTRRAFGPFPSQVVAEEFILSLKKSYAVPKLLRFRPS